MRGRADHHSRVISVDDTISDMYYAQLPTGRPTQADIWSNLPTGIGNRDTCNGLIITPRCDFVHSKSPVLNYLPIVSLEHYLLSTACFTLLEQVINDARAGLRRTAEALGVEHLLELGIPTGEVLGHIKSIQADPTQTKSRQSEKAFREFETNSRRLEMLAALSHKPMLSLDRDTNNPQSKAICTPPA
jgi:hypothetical protein